MVFDRDLGMMLYANATHRETSTSKTSKVVSSLSLTMIQSVSQQRRASAVASYTQ